ncbi:hypothetical protein H0H93_012865, partial [Arthromyces matolae]
RDPKATYALKRYWRPIHADDLELRPTEGEIYKQFDDRLAISGDQVRPKRPKHALASHDIMVNGIPDDTLESIRRGLTSERHKKAIAPLDPLILETDPDAKYRLDRKPTARLQNHQEAHDEFFTLHRDVSCGNLLMFKSLDDDGTTFGRLIDYDHAKQARSTKLVREQKEPPHDNDFRIMQLMLQLLFPLQQPTVNMDVLTEAYNWVDQPLTAAKYISDVVAELPDIAATNSTVDITNIGWKIPGTLPYMSAEVIAGKYIIRPDKKRNLPSFAHEAIHDLESFLWVLVRICLTRQGPGIDEYRDELVEESKEYNPKIAATVKKYFRTGNLSALKDAKADLMD